VIRIAGLIVASIVIAAAAHGAPGAAADSAPHLFVVPAGGPASAALDRTGARVIARYHAFTLVEAHADDARALAAAGADRRDDMRDVAIGARKVDPTTQRRAAAPKASAPDGPGLAVAQFVGPIKDAWLERLRGTGARVVTYLPQNAYLVHGSAVELARLARLAAVDPALRAVVPYAAQDKLREGVGSSGLRRLAIQSLSGDDGSASRDAVARATTRRLRATSAVGPFRTQYVEADASVVPALASSPGVVSIAAAPVYEPQDERQAQIVAGNVSGDPLVPASPDYHDYYDGLGLGSATFGFVVDLTDTGLDRGSTSSVHPDLEEHGIGRVAYADNFSTDPDASDCRGHGTINAGIVAGFNTQTGAAAEDAGGFDYDFGVAPRARIGASKIFTCAGDFSLASSFTALTAHA
jgi:hypothetical protein